MRRLIWRLRRWLFPPKPPAYVIDVYFSDDTIFQWSVGMVYEVSIANARAIVTGFDYPRGVMRVGVWLPPRDLGPGLGHTTIQFADEAARR